MIFGIGENDMAYTALQAKNTHGTDTRMQIDAHDEYATANIYRKKQGQSTFAKVDSLAMKSDLPGYFKNNDLSSYTEDCNFCTRILSFINDSTLNSPYKQFIAGQNISSEGLLISIKPFVSGVYNCQYVLAVGAIQGKHIYTRYKTSDSAWTAWSAVA